MNTTTYPDEKTEEREQMTDSVQSNDGIEETSTFEKVVLVTIAANTAVLVWGLCDHHHEELIDPMHTGFLVFFVVELLLRLRAAGSLRGFLGSGWNVFDSVVIGLSLLPVLGVGVTLLRVARGARVLHSLRHVSHLRATGFVRVLTRQPAEGEL
jgi:voltage-gated sodium channel